MGDGHHVRINDAKEDDNEKHEAGESKLARKGTGFVQLGELPPSDDEDEDEEDHHVKINDSKEDAGEKHEAGESKLARKGTGFVHMGDLDDMDDEEDEEDEDEKHVRMEKGVEDKSEDKSK